MISCSCNRNETWSNWRDKNIVRIILDDFLKHRHWTTARLTTNYTSTAALWSLILRVEAASCARIRFFFFFYRKRKPGEVMEFEVRLGRVTERDVFAGGAGVNEFTVRWTWAPQAALTGTWSRLRGAEAQSGEERHQLWRRGSDCLCSDSSQQNRTARKAHPTPTPAWTGLLPSLHWLLSKASCVRGHPAHADLRDLRWS